MHSLRALHLQISESPMVPNWWMKKICCPIIASGAHSLMWWAVDSELRAAFMTTSWGCTHFPFVVNPTHTKIYLHKQSMAAKLSKNASMLCHKRSHGGKIVRGSFRLSRGSGGAPARPMLHSRAVQSGSLVLGSGSVDPPA